MRKYLVLFLVLMSSFFAVTQVDAFACGTLCTANKCGTGYTCSEVQVSYGSNGCDIRCKAATTTPPATGGAGSSNTGGSSSGGSSSGGSSSTSNNTCSGANNASGCSTVGQIISLGGSCLVCSRGTGTACRRDLTTCPAGTTPNTGSTPVTVPPATGTGGSGGGSSSASNVCGSGSAKGCSGAQFYSVSGSGTCSNGSSGEFVCFPNGVNSSGQTVCGRDCRAQVKPTTDSSGNTVGGNIIETNQANGGCGLVVQCGCASGMQQLCLRDSNMLANEKASEYCARVVCSAIGTDGKVCTPGQVSSCEGTVGKLCNADGKSYSYVNAHACGATHTVAYCSATEPIIADQPSSGQKCTASATRYQSRSDCFKALCPGVNTSTGTCAKCQQGVTQIPPATSYSSVDAYCREVQCKDAPVGGERNACITDCKAEYSGTTGVANLVATTGACIPGGPNFRRFAGCGTGSQVRYNCYSVCTNGVITKQCANEPGLSCGAHESSAVAQVIADLETRFTPTTPSTPKPTPIPTPTPTATCGQPCGANAGGAYCSGSSMACVAGTCRSTLCSASEQNAQCICASPPPNPPICVDIFASKTDIKLGDEVSFTCAQVANAVSYQFRWGYLTKTEGTEGVVMQDLASATSTSRTSQPITVNKVGRYIAQCRPCAANSLCSEWEPIGNENKAPRLEPSTVTTETAETATTQSAQTSLTTEQTSTSSTTSSQESTNSNAETQSNSSSTQSTQEASSSASTASYDSNVCWSKATVGGANWQNSCKGAKDAQGCTDGNVPLTDEEKTGYAAWVAAGSPAITGCN